MTMKYDQKVRSPFLPTCSIFYIVFIISNPDLSPRNWKGDYVGMTLFSILTAPLLENSTYIIVGCREGTRLKCLLIYAEGA